MGVPDMIWIFLGEEIIYKGIIGFLLNFSQKISCQSVVLFIQRSLPTFKGRSFAF